MRWEFRWLTSKAGKAHAFVVVNQSPFIRSVCGWMRRMDAKSRGSIAHCTGGKSITEEV